MYNGKTYHGTTRGDRVLVDGRVKTHWAPIEHAVRQPESGLGICIWFWHLFFTIIP